jgi:uncharacterized phage protein (TIGR02218 family)
MPKDLELLQTHLISGTTTLCWCYKVVRKDGVVMGFTEHDNDLKFDDVVYEALSGFVGSEIAESLGLNVDNQDIHGVLSSDRITDDDISSGVYDSAHVTLYRVNWNDISMRVLWKISTIGEISRGEHIFTAELRGLTHYLQQSKGRVFNPGCDVALGSIRCKVNLENNAYMALGLVNVVTGLRTFECTGLGIRGNTYDWFTSGKLVWTSGFNNGKSVEVRLHSVNNANGKVYLELWQSALKLINVGDTFKVYAGCNKTPRACRDKFGNFVNFQGFPYMPGNDAVATTATTAVTKNGSSRKNIFV